MSAVRVPRALLLAALVLSISSTHASAAVNGPQIAEGHRAARTSTLTSVRVAGDATQPVVEISADGALPQPTVGVVEGPSRIYLDFDGVSPARVRGEGSVGVVARVRVGTHSASPLVTRVVIDLRDRRQYTLDASQRESGVIRISIATPDPAQHTAPPTAATEPPAERKAEAAGTPKPTAAEAPPSRRPGKAPSSQAPRPHTTRDTDAVPVPAAAYRSQITPIVSQLESVRSVLQSIDRRTDVAAAELEAAGQTLDAVQGELGAVRVTRDATVVHDTLRSVCTLASTAVSLARDAKGGAIPLNAASAAAGALLLLDRADAALRPR